MITPCQREKRELLQALYNWRRGNESIDRLPKLEERYMWCQKNRKYQPVDPTFHYRALYTHLLSQLSVPERVQWVLKREI